MNRSKDIPVINDVNALLAAYKEEAATEWMNILHYWMKYTVDEAAGGFYGSVDNDNIPFAAAPKGIVMHSRILWTFAASYRFHQNENFLATARRAYQYIIDHFVDREYGAVYWSVNSDGTPLDDRKQVYGLAFCIYGMSEYYLVTKDESALNLCIRLFHIIEQFSYDRQYGGYLEAFNREWQPIADLRLSEKDDNEKKTMNTHLHIIEAYVNLYRVWPDVELKNRIRELLSIFEKYIIEKNNYHLNLFMNEEWQVKSTLISFGHDIEAAWLLQECAATAGTAEQLAFFKNTALLLADAAREGLDIDGGLWYEYDPAASHLVKEKHSWPQAEAMVGFMNAWQLTGEEKYLQLSAGSWSFIKSRLLDKNKGEWFWGVDENNKVMTGKDKAGFWKCPYHSSRACMEIVKRVDQIVKK